MPRLFALMLLTLSMSLSAQSSVVVPKGWAKKTGRWPGNFMTWPSRDLPVHVQFGYNPLDFGSLNAWLTAIEFRKFPSMRPEPAIVVGTRIEMSHGPLQPEDFTNTFARNAGSTKTLVFSGKVNWPFVSGSQALQPFILKIPFSKSFLLHSSAGKSLVLDAYITSNTIYTNDWQYDTAMRDGGRFVGFNELNAWCKDSQGRRVSLKMWNMKSWIGGSFDLSLFGGTPNAQGLASIGLVGAGGKWGSSKLPIDLAPFGAPGCFWAVASLFYWPFSTDSSGTAVLPIVPIPWTQSLVGLHFFDQSAIFDAQANALGMVPVFSNEWEIGAGEAPSVHTLVSHHDNPPKPQGFAYPRRAPIIRFTIQ